MKMQKFKKAIFWSVLISETGHIFCCVIPLLISALSIMSGLGLISILPHGLLALHEFMHDYEIPLIIFSAFSLALGWILHFVSKRLDCHDTGCHHGSCAPQKDKTQIILWVASLLFIINVTIFATLHLDTVHIH
jgi:hypothetical protein